MKNIKLLKPQPSPKNGREPLANITNCFHSKPKSQKETQRSPSHSPCASSRMWPQESKRVLTPKAPLEAKYMQLPTRCINHRDKQGKFKVEGDSSCHYCESCAVELSQKGKRMIGAKVEDPSAKMLGEARQYLRSLEELMEKLVQRHSEMRVEKYKLDSRYSGLKEDIQQQRRSVIAKINDQYDAQIHKLVQSRGKEMSRIQEEEERLKKLSDEFNTIREDVSDNLNEINIHIDSREFREIMDIYWEKIAKASEKLNKQAVCAVVDSTQAFISKYLPPSEPHRMTFEENIRKGRGTPTGGKEFTFSKKMMAGKCKQVLSWEQSNPSCESSESIVQERIKIK